MDDFHGDGLNLCDASNGAHFMHGLQEQPCFFFRPGQLVLHFSLGGLRLG